MLSDSCGPQSMSSVLSGIAGSKVGTVEQVIDFGEVVLVAIPFKYYSSLPAMYLKGKIVLDANNYYPERDGRIAALDRFETTTSRLLAEHLRYSRVVKVFNAILS